MCALWMWRKPSSRGGATLASPAATAATRRRRRPPPPDASSWPRRARRRMSLHCRHPSHHSPLIYDAASTGGDLLGDAWWKRPVSTTLWKKTYDLRRCDKSFLQLKSPTPNAERPRTHCDRPPTHTRAHGVPRPAMLPVRCGHVVRVRARHKGTVLTSIDLRQAASRLAGCSGIVALRLDC